MESLTVVTLGLFLSIFGIVVLVIALQKKIRELKNANAEIVALNKKINKLENK